jgi:hypothetical protein
MTQKELTLFFVWCWFAVLKKQTAGKLRRQKRAAYLSEYRRDWNLRNKKVIAKRRRARYILTQEERRETQRIWAKANPEKYAAGILRWRAAHKEQIREWYRERSARKQKEDVGWRLGRCLRKRIWDAVRGISKKADSTQALIGCSAEELKRHLQIRFRPGMSWDNYGEWHIDHIRPCASFDLTDPEQQRACFNFKNLQPLWAKDNLSKGAKYATKP